MTDWIAADWPAPQGIVAGTTLRSSEPGNLPLHGEPCFLNQVHGTDVVVAAHFASPPSADASVSGADGRLCVVRTADCLPVLMCSVDGRSYAAAHAGWRGLAAGIVERTLERMTAEPSNVMAWLGPAISQPSFEVGAEVRAAFLKSDTRAAACFVRNERGRWQADLYGLARRRLNAAGVTKISGGGFCTYLDKERFYSYRRNPDCGRMLSFIGLNTP
jgi:YfiH family protein